MVMYVEKYSQNVSVIQPFQKGTGKDTDIDDASKV